MLIMLSLHFHQKIGKPTRNVGETPYASTHIMFPMAQMLDLMKTLRTPELIIKVVSTTEKAMNLIMGVILRMTCRSGIALLSQASVDIRTIQELLGLSDLKTTMINTHTVPSV